MEQYVQRRADSIRKEIGAKTGFEIGSMAHIVISLLLPRQSKYWQCQNPRSMKFHFPHTDWLLLVNAKFTSDKYSICDVFVSLFHQLCNVWNTFKHFIKAVEAACLATCNNDCVGSRYDIHGTGYNFHRTTRRTVLPRSRGGWIVYFTDTPVLTIDILGSNSICRVGINAMSLAFGLHCFFQPRLYLDPLVACLQLLFPRWMELVENQDGRGSYSLPLTID